MSLPLIAFSALASGLGNFFGGNKAAKAARQAGQLQQQRFDQAVGYLNPYIQGGQRSFDLYNTATGANGREGQQQYFDEFQTDPGFESATRYGLNQTTARLAAQGLGGSGTMVNALNDQARRDMFGQFQQRLDNLYRGATVGAGAGNALASAATSSGQAQGNFTQAAGQQLGATYSNIGSIPYGAATDYLRWKNAPNAGV